VNSANAARLSLRLRFDPAFGTDVLRNFISHDCSRPDPVHKGSLFIDNIPALFETRFPATNASTKHRADDIDFRRRNKTFPQNRIMLEPLTAGRVQVQLPAYWSVTQTLHLSRSVAVLLGVSLLGLASSRLFYPFDTGNYEAFIWSPSQLAISGQNPYSFALSPPFVMAPYGIVYYELIGLGTQLFGLQLWFGRLASVLAAAICLVCIWRITASLTDDARAPWYGVIAFMSSATLQSWLSVQRPDLVSLAMAFVAVALVFTTNWKTNSAASRIVIVLVLLVAAFFTKQTTLVPVAVVVARLWQVRERRRAVMLLIGFAALCLSVMVWLNGNSGGGYLWEHWTHAIRLPFDFKRAFGALLAVCKNPATWVLAGTYFLALYESRKSLREVPKVSARWLLVIYLLIAFLFGFVSSARLGANINYYLEASIIASIVFAVALTRITESSKWGSVGATIVLLLAVSSAWQIMRFGRGEYFRWRSLPYFMEIAETVERSTPRDSICISVYPDLVTRVGRTFHFDDFGEYSDGLSPVLQQAFNDAISSRRYGAILWHDDQATFPGYRLKPMVQQVPKKFYSVYLYLREP